MSNQSSSPQGSSHQEDQDNQELSRQRGGVAGTPSSEADRTQFLSLLSAVLGWGRFFVGGVIPADQWAVDGFSGAVVWHLWFSPGLSYTLFMGGYYQSRCICGLGVCKRPTGAGSGGWEQAASRLVPNGPVRALIGS